jgi:hypothetical protein
MPFSRDAFLDVFAAYNQALWPFVVALWLCTGVLVAALISGRRVRAMPRLLLAGHWVWAGVMYHAIFFTAINPAAWVFAGAFVVQAAMLASASSLDRLIRLDVRSLRGVASSALIIYSLLYPLIAWADGFVYPQIPTFGVPCPTVILTIGLLLASSTESIALTAIPVVWSLIAASAAWSFGIHADFALPAAAVMLAGDLIMKRSHVMKKLLVAGCVALAVALPRVAVGQTPQHLHDRQTQSSDPARMGQMGEMKMGVRMMEQMEAKHKANTERIAALMAQVKSAMGDAKTAALAEVITVLLEERALMQEHCAAMMGK